MNLIIPKLCIKRLKLFLISNLLTYTLSFLFISLFLIIFIIHDAKLLYQKKYQEADSSYRTLISKLSLVSYQNFTNLYTFLLNPFFVNFFEGNKVAIFLLGSLRIIQFQFELPSFCYETQGLARFQNNCNPYFSQSLSGFSKDVMDSPLDSNLCVQKDCSEFILNEMAHVISSTKWNNDFPKSAFTVDINTKNGTLFKEEMEKLRRNQWIHENKTRVLIIDFNVFEEIYHTIFKFELIFEKPAGDENNQILLTTKKYVINHYQNRNDIVMTLFIPLYAIATILYFFKTIFMYGYTQNSCYSVDFSIIIIDLNFLISYIIEYSEYLDVFSKDLDSEFNSKDELKNKFYNLSSLKIYCSYRLFIVFLESLVLSFRLYQFFGNLTNFSFYNKFMNAFFRSLTALIKTLFCLGFIVFGWSLGIFILFGDLEINFQSVTHTVLSFFGLNPWNLSDSDYFQRFNRSDSSFFFLCGWLFFFVMKLTILGYFFAIVRVSIKKSNQFEYETPDIKGTNIKECVNQMNKKINKFSKNYLNHLEGEMLASNKKIIIWLDNNLLTEEQYQELNNLTTRLDIKLIPFYEPHQILDFLQFLFRLKPNLMYKSGSLFRIMIENKEKTVDQLNKYEMHFTELILDWLRVVGCRVPLCFFMKMKVKENDLIMIKKIYQNMFMTSSFDDVISFCALKPMTHFVRKVIERDDSSVGSESEESRLIIRNEE